MCFSIFVALCLSCWYYCHAFVWGSPLKKRGETENGDENNWDTAMNEHIKGKKKERPNNRIGIVITQ
jgi:hypothetical protein